MILMIKKNKRTQYFLLFPDKTHFESVFFGIKFFKLKPKNSRLFLTALVCVSTNDLL